ncbi:proteasome activator complex subunit 4-like [Vanessa atalanta]|uniref:proteasome activator complex subunit 4-like n=1 Tax=Vanessa atalanta TaxID=42275 RepID=UPI001FCD4B67|nr:proteasome activator complex subunit 4-like [Vanessa atalanta]
MIQDDEYEAYVATPERIKALGFKPQKEIITCHLLPYADKIDEESKIFLEQVKTNLAKAVMLREMKPACGVWSSRLMKYIRIYGLKFPKEDHIAFIKLAYELVLIPDLEPCKVHKFATMFIMLTKKRYLLSPEELTLPWRPLYEVGIKIFDKSSTSIGMYHYLTRKSSEKQEVSKLEMVRKFLSGYGLDDALELFGLSMRQNENELPTSLEGSYMSMVKCARTYFEVGATKEILEELLPLICPWSSNSQMMGPLTNFLPIGLHPKYAKQGHELWFGQLMALWDSCYNSQCGISDVMILFAGLAKRNPGAIDWTPHVPKLFMRFLHGLNLPVSYKDMQYSRSHSLDMKCVASWIVWTINPDGVVLKHLRSFLAGFESYLHSANSGRWSFKLRDLLRKLAREFLNRVRREREKRFRQTWENKTPELYKLRDEDVTEFVKIVLEPTFQAVYSRSGSLDISIALHNLAILRPAIVIPPLLEKLKTSLTSLTEPHRVTAAMSAVAAVARPMLRGADADYPEGPTHVVPFLMAVLPGLDPNDIKKTLVTLHFILIFSSMVPYIDCSSAHEHWPDLTDEELLVCESTAQLEDFVLIFLDRIFIIIESSVLEHARLDTKDSDCARSKTDAVMETAISSAATAVLTQCSPKIFKEALRKFKSFATESTFETNVSGSMVGVLLHVFARINSESTLAAFLPKLLEELEELTSSDEALREENPPRDLVYRLVLLMHVVDCDGTVLLKYIPQILPVLDRILKLHAKYALTRACEVLSHILNSMSYVDLKEWKSSSEDFGTAPEKWLPIREWGRGCLLKDTNFKWHVPSAEEAKCAQMISDRYLKHEVTRLKQWLSGERSMSRERRLRSFHIINSVMSCSTFLPQPNEEPITLLETQVPPTSMPFANAVPYTVTLDGENMRVALTRLLLEVQAKMLSDKTDDTRGLEMLLQAWERVVVLKGLRTGPGLEARLRSYGALERALDGRGGRLRGGLTASARLRMLIADAARLQDEARLDLVCDAGITPSAMKAVHALYDLAINTYSSVRIFAQIRLYWMLSHYPYSYRALIPRLVDLLAAGGEGDEWHARHKGALFMMLGPKAGPLVAKQDWEVVGALWPAILKAPLSEKPTIHRLEHAFSETLHRHFPAVNTRLTMSQAAVDAAKCLLSEEQLNDTEFMEQLEKSVEREIATSDKTEKVYIQLVNDLVTVAENSKGQWRRLELAMQMLTYCPLVQTPYPPRAVRLMVQSLLHDDITVRRIAQKLTHFALKQRKHKIKKIEVDPYEIAGVERPEKHVPGYRKDIEWAMWSEDNDILTDEEWDKPWLRDYNYGFYAWPKKIKVAAPVSEQTYSIDRAPEDMEEGERYLYEFFSDEANIERLVAFFTVEEKKGKDKFNGIRYAMFRMAFAQFGERVSRRLLQRAVCCAGDAHEAPQRFAAELATAALRAPRDWPRARALALQAEALDVIKAGLTAVTPETIEDWGTCVATGVEKMDPRRGAAVLRGLLQLCAPPPARGDSDPDQSTSFVLCARLYALQGALGCMSWRAAPLAVELLKRLESANFIQHPYQNVREIVGSILMTIFDTELVIQGGENGVAPCLKDFIATVEPRLDALYDDNGDIVVKTAVSIGGQCGARETIAAPENPVAPITAIPLTTLTKNSPHVARLSTETPRADHAHQAEGSDSAETESEDSVADKQLVERLNSALRLSGDVVPAQRHHARAVNLLTTVLRGCMGVIVRGVYGNTETQYELVTTACALASRGPPQPHEELPRAAGGFLASLALANHSCSAFNKALEVLETLAKSRSWWARLACLDFAQPLLFYGLPMLCDEPERAVRAEKFALKLMRDSRVEVRQSAAKLLTGLMHCRALPNEDKTLKSLKRSCRSKDLVERHCGVLGLCAYLASRPYSLGPELGNVLAELSRHTSAPDPIPATIRTALADFRRTHHDDWPKHREQLTEDELDLLADLTSPPSYCA